MDEWVFGGRCQNAMNSAADPLRKAENKKGLESMPHTCATGPAAKLVTSISHEARIIFWSSLCPRIGNDSFKHARSAFWMICGRLFDDDLP
jgi:hypothetical protein